MSSIVWLQSMFQHILHWCILLTIFFEYLSFKSFQDSHHWSLARIHACVIDVTRCQWINIMPLLHHSIKRSLCLIVFCLQTIQKLMQIILGLWIWPSLILNIIFLYVTQRDIYLLSAITEVDVKMSIPTSGIYDYVTCIDKGYIYIRCGLCHPHNFRLCRELAIPCFKQGQFLNQNQILREVFASPETGLNCNVYCKSQ